MHFGPRPDLAEQLAWYLRAAPLAARDHPYPGVVPGATPPPLHAVYVRQQVRAQAWDLPPAGAEGPRLAWGSGADVARSLLPQLADEALGADAPRLVVVAGPGSGKSSLLRLRVTECLARWGDGPAATLPVVVPASALVGRPLAEALADAVNAELWRHLPGRLGPELFLTEPRPGVRWEVLVDGVDEIHDPRTRRDLLTGLADAGDPTHRPGYRIVVASRPLPDEELDALGRDTPVFALQPFAPDDLTHFAQVWFTTSGAPNAEQRTTSFLAALHQAGLFELARIPLMATMLCQLHLAGGDGAALPVGRGAVYREFVRLLHDRQHRDGVAGVRGQVHVALRRWGDDVLRAADATLDAFPVLVRRLAAHRYDHGDEPVAAVAFLAAQPEGAPPSEQVSGAWEEFLAQTLRSSGLLSDHQGDFAFLHQSLLEHLAAVHRDDPAEEARRLVAGSWVRYKPLSNESLNYLAWFDGRRSRFYHWGRRLWRRPDVEPSYVGFLVDAAMRQPPDARRALDRALQRAATRGGLQAWVFLAELGRLGTNLPRSVIGAARESLDGLFAAGPGESFDDLWHFYQSLTTLAGSGESWAADILAAHAANSDVDGYNRVVAARGLAGVDPERAADLLADMVTQWHHTHTFLHRAPLAWRELARIDPERATALLDAVAPDPSEKLGAVLFEVAERLLSLDVPRGRQRMEFLAAEPRYGLWADAARAALVRHAE